MPEADGLHSPCGLVAESEVFTKKLSTSEDSYGGGTAPAVASATVDTSNLDSCLGTSTLTEFSIFFVGDIDWAFRAIINSFEFGITVPLEFPESVKVYCSGIEDCS